MRLRRTVLVVLAVMVVAAAATTLAWAAGYKFTQANPGTYDPAHTYLAQAGWIAGIGCPTHSWESTTGHRKPDARYTDPACPTGDKKDTRNEGLLLAKTGPTAQYTAAGVNLKDVKGTPLTELGYDIRKPGTVDDLRGSHCAAGSPRFLIITMKGKTYFIGCNSPPPDSQTAGNGWLRLRWGGNGTLLAYDASTNQLTNISGVHVRIIQVVLDDGQDSAPDNFGLAVLDNIDVNGTLVGQGSGPSGNPKS